MFGAAGPLRRSKTQRLLLLSENRLVALRQIKAAGCGAEPFSSGVRPGAWRRGLGCAGDQGRVGLLIATQAFRLSKRSERRAPSGKAQSSGVDWRLRFNGIRDWLKHNTTEDDLFSASCLVAEIMAQHQRPKPSTAMDLLERDAKDNGLLKAIGPDRVRRTIANGLRHVEEKVLAATEE
jgi:hypothetical protein